MLCARSLYLSLSLFNLHWAFYFSYMVEIVSTQYPEVLCLALLTVFGKFPQREVYFKIAITDFRNYRKQALFQGLICIQC